MREGRLYPRWSPNALSGYGAPTDKERAREAGFDHHFVKPVDAATLARVLAADR